MKRKKLKKFLKAASFAVIFSLCCGIIIQPSENNVVHSVTTSELEQKIADLQQENAQLDSQISQIDSDIADSQQLQNLVYQKLVNQKDEIDYLNNKIYYKEADIQDREKKIAEKDDSIALKEAEIEDKKVQIADLEKQNEENIYKFGQIIRAMYITSNEDIFTVLMGSKDFNDLLVRTELMKNISDQNKTFMNDLLDAIDELNEKNKQLADEITQLEADKAQLEEDKATLITEKEDLENQRTESKALQDQYNSDYNTYSTQIANFEAKQDNLEYQKKLNAQEVADYQAQITEIIKAAQAAASGDVVYDNGEWMWPLSTQFHLITTYFGYDDWRSGNHSGIDIGNSGINGANIYASKGGEVIVAKTSYVPGYSYGKYVVIDHGDGYTTLYGHCSEVYVSVGQKVNQGDIIAAVGSTGWSTGPHLHFEVRINGVAQNPFNYVNLPG